MVWKLMVLPMCFALSGCVFTAPTVINAEIPTGEIDKNGKPETVIKPVELDRWGSHTLVRMAEEKTTQAFIAAEKEEQSGPQQQRKEDITVILDTPEAVQAWASVEAMRSMGQTNTNLSKALDNCITGKKTQSIDLTRSPMPQGVFAESVSSVTDGTAKILNTDAAKVGTLLFGAAKVAEQAKPDQPTTQIQTTADVAAGGGVITKPVTTSTTEILQPAILE